MIYLIKSAGLYKIGFSANVEQRIRDLQSANAEPLQLVTSWPGSLYVEKYAHRQFAHKRVRGEWFDLDDHDLEALDTLLRPLVKRGRPRADVGMYICTGCASDKPTIRNGVHVECACGAAPNSQLARLWDLPDWPRVIEPV